VYPPLRPCIEVRRNRIGVLLERTQDRAALALFGTSAPGYSFPLENDFHGDFRRGMRRDWAQKFSEFWQLLSAKPLAAMRMTELKLSTSESSRLDVYKLAGSCQERHVFVTGVVFLSAALPFLGEARRVVQYRQWQIVPSQRADRGAGDKSCHRWRGGYSACAGPDAADFWARSPRRARRRARRAWGKRHRWASRVVIM
jgi:hypothetical protein